MRTGGKGVECEEEASSSRLDTKSVIKNNANLASPRLLQTGRPGTRASRYLDVAHGACPASPSSCILISMPPSSPIRTININGPALSADQSTRLTASQRGARTLL